MQFMVVSYPRIYVPKGNWQASGSTYVSEEMQDGPFLINLANFFDRVSYFYWSIELFLT